MYVQVKSIREYELVINSEIDNKFKNESKVFKDAMKELLLTSFKNGISFNQGKVIEVEISD